MVILMTFYGVAKISPFSMTNAVPDRKIKELAKAIEIVLTEATAKIHAATLA
jgi:hypothetical protein